MFRDRVAQNRSHNQLVPVSRLPAEVFGEIFDLLQTRTHDNPDRPGYHPDLFWIPEATHVCHAWREVALHTAMLWQDINVSASSSWAVEFMLRSKQAPLHISASNSEIDTNARTWPLICECTEKLVHASAKRVQSIVLDDIPDSSIHRILSSRSSPVIEFPILSRLEVATLEHFILTGNTVCAPSLESLTLRDFCSVDWENAFSLFQNLSYLNINTYDDAPVADLGAIYEALCQMPNLVQLSLSPENSYVGPEAIVLPTEPHSPAPLPNLRTIRLETFFPIWLSSILSCIAYGLRRDLSIRATCDEEASSFEELLSNLPSIMQHVKESSIRSLHINIFTGHICFTGWRWVEKNINEAWRDASVDITIQIPKRLQSRSTYPFGPGVFLLNKSLRGIHFRRLTSLTLTVFKESIPTETWVLHFGSLPNLSMVEIRLGLHELCAALVNDIKATPDSPQPSTLPPFRALQSITVQEEKPYSDGDLDYIRRCLQQRLDLEVPLKELRITFEKDGRDHGLVIGALKKLVTVEFVVATKPN